MGMKTDWQSETPNPDEEQLIAEFEAEARIEEHAYAEEAERAKSRQADIEPLLKATGLSKADMKRNIRQGRIDTRDSLQKAQTLLSAPVIDIDVQDSQDLAVAKRVAQEATLRGNPSWSGWIWNASYGGWWSNWNGEGEEVPYTVINTGAERIDSRSQAWGEGWFDGDYSQAHGYLAFKFNPPHWGHLHISVWPRIHGYYSLSAHDHWYTSTSARVELDHWVQVHQNFWRTRAYVRRLTLSGSNLTRWGRIDSQFAQTYRTTVGAGDTVTIRVGVRLYSYAKSSHAYSKLDFLSGSGNYVSVPYVYWYLHT